MAGIFDVITEKLNLRGRGGGDKSQLVLAAGLVLIIIISISIVFSNMGGSSKTTTAQQMIKVQDLETGEVFELDPTKMTPETMVMGMPGERIPNPNTGKKTCVIMLKCPACGEYFVPEYAKTSNPEMMMDPGPLICTHCGIDLNKWYREHKKKKRK